MAAYRVLSFDGGGILGLLTASLLDRLLIAYPNLIRDADLVAGTSTGGIIALGLAKGLSPGEIRVLYELDGPKIFEDTWRDNLLDLGNSIGAEYSNRHLQKVVKSKLGSRTRLADLNKRVVIPAFDLDNWNDRRRAEPQPRRWKPKVFHNFSGPDTDGEYPAWKVAMYTSAAPTYFPSFEGYIDGGVYANNPAMIALAQTQDPKNRAAERPAIGDVRLLSIGTGESPRFIEGKSLDWGYAQWAKPLVSLMLESTMGVSDYQCQRLLGERYHRLQPHLPEGTRFDIDSVDKIPEIMNFSLGLDLDSTLDWIGEHW